MSLAEIQGTKCNGCRCCNGNFWVKFSCWTSAGEPSIQLWTLAWSSKHLKFAPSQMHNPHVEEQLNCRKPCCRWMRGQAKPWRAEHPAPPTVAPCHQVTDSPREMRVPLLMGEAWRQKVCCCRVSKHKEQRSLGPGYHNPRRRKAAQKACYDRVSSRTECVV